MTETFWIKASNPNTLANSPDGLSHYTEQSHLKAEEFWEGSIVDINHESVKSGADPVGEVVDTFYISGEGLYQKIEVSDPDIISVLENDEHTGFSIGTIPIEKDGASTLEYKPDHVSVVLEPQTPMCDKENCDILASAEGDFMYSNAVEPVDDDIDLSQLSLPPAMKARVFEIMLENKRFSKEVVFNAIEEVVRSFVGSVSESGDDGERLGRLEGSSEGDLKRDEIPNELFSQEQFSDFEDCVLRFKDGGRSKDESINACRRIFKDETASLEKFENLSTETGSSDNTDDENTKLSDDTMTDCDCDNSHDFSAKEYHELSTQVDNLSSKVDSLKEDKSDLQDGLDEKEVELSSRKERVEELEGQVENLSTELDAYKEEKRQALISELPESENIDYSEKSIERLQELKEFHTETSKQTAGGTPANANTSSNGDNDEPTEFVKTLRELKNGDN